MNPMEQLRAEHEGILTMLKILEKISEQMASGKKANLDHLEKIMEFLSVFADKCHHGKEEDILFPALEKAGIPREDGPIGVMLHDHEQGRADIRVMRQALEDMRDGRDGGKDFIEAARDYIDLLRSHILKENDVLFMIAERSLSGEQQKAVFDAFETLEREKIGFGRHESFHLLMDELGRIYL
jgi:hemerythrin-like domain-containing protein